MFNLKRIWAVGGVLLGLLTAPLTAATINVPSGGDFQAALNSANPGDTIVLQAGATFSTAGGFTLPNKGSGTQVITIQSSALSQLPAAGYRVHPADALHMPKLVSTVNASPVLQTAAGAHHYNIVGVEFSLAPGLWSYVMVFLGTGVETQVSQLPHDITIDRCYVHGDPTAQPGTKRGIELEAANATVQNSYISEIHVVGQDNQAIASFNGTGPFKILNNYLEAATENVLFGGADPKIPNLVPTDIEVRNNYFFKPLSWYPNDASYAGIHWAVKNLFELKNAQRVLVDGNILENCWLDGQTGSAVLITPRDQDGTAPWSIVKDVTYTHNIVRHSASGFQLLSDDNHPPGSLPTANITIRDNVIEDINPTQFGGNGIIFAISRAGKTATNYAITHNTALHHGTGNSFITLGDSGIVVDQFKFNDNLVTHGSYGLKGGGTGEGTVALDTFVTHYTVTKNAIIAGGRPQDYPAGNLFPATAADIGFVNFNNGNGGDYHLLPASPYKNAGTDGKDLGADIDTVLAATCGTILGIPTSSCSSYVPPTLPPPGSATPATPTLQLPAFLPINAKISAGYSGADPAAFYSWSFTPVDKIPMNASPRSAPARAPAASLTTSVPQANLGALSLALGPYLVAVQVMDQSNNTSPAAQAYVTLVPANLSTVRIYPNPWRADRHAGAPITFDRLAVNSTVKIFTISGELVKSFPVSSTAVTWDLTNDSGDRVASGLYLYLITADSGLKKTGQLAIIR